MRARMGSLLPRHAVCLLALGMALALAFAAPAAQAERQLLKTKAVEVNKVPEGQVEGACGLAVIGEKLYLSDYYHHAVDVFRLGGYFSRIAGDPLDGPCQLASSAGGALYANNWHEGVERLLPSRLVFDENESTGVAVDQVNGNVYVNDRTYVAVYGPSGAPILDGEGMPLRIGVGSLEDAYGLALGGGRVYVADAGDDSVKVYEPSLALASPVLTIGGPGAGQSFSSLADATLAIDPGSEHLLVLDNLQPGFEHPKGAIDEFAIANGAFVGQVAERVIDGEPSGMVVSEGKLYVTSGNDEGSTVFEFGPYSSTGGFAAGPPSSAGSDADASSGIRAGAAFAASGVTEDGPAPSLRLSQAKAAPGPVATLRLTVAEAGKVSLAGAHLESVRRRLWPGAELLRLRLDAAGARELRSARNGRLRIPVRVRFEATSGAVAKSRSTVEFRGEGSPR